jgi:hypothetical protein
MDEPARWQDDLYDLFGATMWRCSSMCPMPATGC